MTRRRCAVYARVSTDMQGESLENQVAYAQEYVRRLGDAFELMEACIYTDFDQSGYYTRFLERPAIQRALSEASVGKYDVIVFKEISRISRDQAEHIEIVSRFTQAGVRVIAINDNLDSDRPETLDLLGIHSVMAEMESKRISSRVSTGKKMLARRGMWMGEAPIGYRVDEQLRTLVIDPDFAPTVQLIFHLFAVERLSLSRTATYLNHHGYTTKHGRAWTRATIGQVLRNPAYVGDMVYGKTRNVLRRRYDDRGYTKRRGRDTLPEEEWIVIHDAHPPLVSRALFDEVRRRRTGLMSNNTRKAQHPLTGLLTCGMCGAGMVCQRRTVNGRLYRYYQCTTAFRSGREACAQPNLPATDLERAIWQHIMDLCQQVLHDAHGKETHVLVVTPNASNLRVAAQEKERLEQRLARARLGLERLLQDVDVVGESYERMKANFVTTIQHTEAELVRWQVQSDASRSQIRHHAIAEILLRITDEITRVEPEAKRVLRLERIRLRFHQLIHHVIITGWNIDEIELHYQLQPICFSPHHHIDGTV